MTDFKRKSLDDMLTGDEPKQEVTEKPEAQTTEPAASEGMETEEPESGGGKQVPLAALQAERGKVKRYTEQVASFEQTLKDREAAWERRFEELIGTLKPKEQPQEAPDPFTDFGGAVDHQVSRHFQPMASELGHLRTQLAQLRAASVFGGEEALGEFMQFAVEAQQRGDPAYAEVSAAMDAAEKSGKNPFVIGKEWFTRHKMMKDIGSDPAAYKEKLKAEILAELNGGEGTTAVTTGGNGGLPVMPSNLAGTRNVGTRAGPAWAGPKPLNDIFKR